MAAENIYVRLSDGSRAGIDLSDLPISTQNKEDVDGKMLSIGYLCANGALLRTTAGSFVRGSQVIEVHSGR